MFLFALAVAIVSGSMYYTSIIVRKVAEQEQTNVKIWADAIYRKTELVKYIEQFSSKYAKKTVRVLYC